MGLLSKLYKYTDSTYISHEIFKESYEHMKRRENITYGAIIGVLLIGGIIMLAKLNSFKGGDGEGAAWALVSTPFFIMFFALMWWLDIRKINKRIAAEAQKETQPTDIKNTSQ